MTALLFYLLTFMVGSINKCYREGLLYSKTDPRIRLMWISTWLLPNAYPIWAL